MRWRMMAAGAALGVLAWPAAAQVDQTTADLRCAIVGMAMAGQATTQQQGMMAALYYIGKLDGRTPDLDLEQRVRSEAAGMTPQVIAAEGQRCGQELMARGKALATIGEHLTGAAKTP